MCKLMPKGTRVIASYNGKNYHGIVIGWFVTGMEEAIVGYVILEEETGLVYEFAEEFVREERRARREA